MFAPELALGKFKPLTVIERPINHEFLQHIAYFDPLIDV